MSSSTEANRTLKFRVKSKIFLNSFRLIQGAAWYVLTIFATKYKYKIKRKQKVRCAEWSTNVVCCFVDWSNPNSCKLSVLPEKQEFHVTICMPLDIHRIYILQMEEVSVILQADFEKDSCPHQMVITPAVMRQSLNVFLTNLNEITFVAHKNFFKMKSHHDNLTNAQDIVSTELSIDTSDFTMYKIGSFDDNNLSITRGGSGSHNNNNNNNNNSYQAMMKKREKKGVKVTVCMKEVKAFVALMEALDCQVFIYMKNSPGEPLLVNSGGDRETTFECSLVLASVPVKLF